MELPVCHLRVALQRAWQTAGMANKRRRVKIPRVRLPAMCSIMLSRCLGWSDRTRGHLRFIIRFVWVTAAACCSIVGTIIPWSDWTQTYVKYLSTSNKQASNCSWFVCVGTILLDKWSRRLMFRGRRSFMDGSIIKYVPLSYWSFNVKNFLFHIDCHSRMAHRCCEQIPCRFREKLFSRFYW